MARGVPCQYANLHRSVFDQSMYRRIRNRDAARDCKGTGNGVRVVVAVPYTLIKMAA